MSSALSATNDSPFCASKSASEAIARAAVTCSSGPIGHLLHPRHDHEIRQLARHRDIAQAQRRRARAAGRLDLDRLDPAQPHPVADQRAQVLLPIERARTHVADVERIDAFDLGVLDGGLDRLGRQILEGFLPVLADRGLSYSDNRYVSHFSLESFVLPFLSVARAPPSYSIRIFSRWRAYVA